MKTFFLLFTLAFGLLAQTPITVCPQGPATVAAGGQIPLDICLVNGAATIKPAALQWTLALPNAFVLDETPVVGPAAGSVQKSLYCAADFRLCLVVGPNQNVMQDGVIARYNVKVPATTTPGPFAISLSGIVAASQTGSAIATTSTNYTVTVQPVIGDLNGDGKINGQDFDLAVDQITKKTACTNGDLNGDTSCNVIDLQILVVKMLAAVNP